MEIDELQNVLKLALEQTASPLHVYGNLFCIKVPTTNQALNLKYDAKKNLSSKSHSHIYDMER